MIFLFFWLALAGTGALVLGLSAIRMRQQWRESFFVPSLTRLLGAVSLLCLGLVWLAIRGIENYNGIVSPGALILTAFLFPTVATGIHFGALILGLVEHRAPKEQHMPAKPWYTSRTVWFNVISLMVAAAGLLLDPSLALDQRVVAVATGVVTIGNMALRMLTSRPIAGTPADVPAVERERLVQ
jgi:hypothetical protein